MERRPHPSSRYRASSAATGNKGRPAAKPRSRQRKSYRTPLRLPLANHPRRLRVVLIGLAVIMSLCGGRLLQLQGLDPQAYAAAAQNRLTTKEKLYPLRGSLTDRNGTVLAASAPGVTITADPTQTTPRAAQIAAVLVAHLGGTDASYLPALTRPGTRFAYVTRQVPAATYDAITAELTAQNLIGIHPENDTTRSYPGDTLAAQVIGSVGADSHGLTGFEYRMNSQLIGSTGYETYETSPNGSKIPLGAQALTPARNGTSYQLTIDAPTQYMLERRLAARAAQVGAEHAMAVTMNVRTGEVLAMASTPSYDANAVAKANGDEIANHAISDAYEPGSVEKVLTFAALVDGGYATDTTRVKIPPTIASGGGRLKDDEAHGYIQLTGRGVLARSSNIGTVLLTRQMPIPRLRAYLVSFGLGAKTGIELPGEAAGYLPPANMSHLTRDQIAFGQGVSVTALQEAAAIAGIVNGGVYNPPTIVRSATDADGRQVKLDRPAPRRVVTQGTAKMVASMMESVTGAGGTASFVDIPGYRVGGKTGTAQRIDPKCKCYRGYTTSFALMAPAENPAILTYVVFDQPRSSQTGGGSAGPVSQDITQFALNQFGIIPSTTKGPSGGLTW